MVGFEWKGGNFRKEFREDLEARKQKVIAALARQEEYRRVYQEQLALIEMKEKSRGEKT